MRNKVSNAALVSMPKIVGCVFLGGLARQKKWYRQLHYLDAQTLKKDRNMLSGRNTVKEEE